MVISYCYHNVCCYYYFHTEHPIAPKRIVLLASLMYNAFRKFSAINYFLSGIVHTRILLLWFANDTSR